MRTLAQLWQHDFQIKIIYIFRLVKAEYIILETFEKIGCISFIYL